MGISGGGLFPQTGLLNDVGELKERWGQGGSNVVNVSTGGAGTLHTVTAGKTFYIKSITVQEASGNASAITILDGGAGGTQKWYWKNVTGFDYLVVTFDVPLKFETDVHGTVSVGTYTISFSGWEE